MQRLFGSRVGKDKDGTGRPPTPPKAGDDAGAPIRQISHRVRSGSQIKAELESSRVKKDVAEDHTLAPKHLVDILSSSKLRYAFRNFLRKKAASEALMAFEAIELYEGLPNASSRERTAVAILDKFIRQGSPNEINVSAETRAELLGDETKHAWNENSFHNCKRDMYALLDENFFESFVDLYWPGGVLIAKAGDVFLMEPGRDSSYDPNGSGAKRDTGSHIHDEETVKTMAYLEV